MKHDRSGVKNMKQNPEIYPRSIHEAQGNCVCMARYPDRDVLLAEKDTLGFESIPVMIDEKSWYQSELNHAAAERLRTLFPFTAPRRVLGQPRTFGTGDRLGVAGTGILRAFAQYDALPVLAQQSIRELKQTGRSYAEVIDSATFAVFRENFQRGFGADGDHIKTMEEIDEALQSGCTMLTLDCSEHIRGEAAEMPIENVMAEFGNRKALEEEYLREHVLSDGTRICFTKGELARAELIYRDAIRFIEAIYHRYVCGGAVDFEISIDETPTPTTPAQHFFVANELEKLGVPFLTLAPRFCGEFQKGIEYIGNLMQFEREFRLHASIADHFGYKLSIHSGSDKFSVYPAVGKYSGGRFHVKVSGTNWLEAMRLVAEKAPELYREIHAFALGVFAEAKQFYHVSAEPERIPSLEFLPDEQLPDLLEQSDARQLIHICYGYILQARKPDGTTRFQQAILKTLRDNEQAYAALLEAHIGKHLKLLYEQQTTA